MIRVNWARLRARAWDIQLVAGVGLLIIATAAETPALIAWIAFWGGVNFAQWFFDFNGALVHLRTLNQQLESINMLNAGLRGEMLRLAHQIEEMKNAEGRNPPA